MKKSKSKPSGKGTAGRHVQASHTVGEQSTNKSPGKKAGFSVGSNQSQRKCGPA